MKRGRTEKRKNYLKETEKKPKIMNFSKMKRKKKRKKKLHFKSMSG